jgi:hypothetical protein
MLRFIYALLAGLTCAEAGSVPLSSNCSPLWLDSASPLQDSVVPDPFTIRAAEGYIQKPATPLTQPLKFCKCDSGIVMSSEVRECAAVYASMQTKLGDRTVSSLPIMLNQIELNRAQTMAAKQVLISRRILQMLAGNSASEFVIQMQKEFSLPTEAIDSLTKMRTLLAKISNAAVYLENPGLADYPYLVGIHAFDLRAGVMQNSFIDFNFWPHSSRGIHQNMQALSQLKQAAQAKGADVQTWGQAEAHHPPLQKWLDYVTAAAQSWTGKSENLIAIHLGLVEKNDEWTQILRQLKIPLIDLRSIVQSDDGTMYWRGGSDGVMRPFDAAISMIDEAELLSMSRAEPVAMMQQFVDNQKLGQSIGKELGRGIWYDYVYDDRQEVIGIKTDDQGNPKLFRGNVGSRFSSESKLDFVQAISQRKLYLTGLGAVIYRHPVVTETMSRLAVLLACRELKEFDANQCDAMAGFGRDSKNNLMRDDARIDLVEVDGSRKRFDFVELLPESQATARKFIMDQARQFQSQILIRPRQHLHTAMSVTDSGDGSQALVNRVASLRFFILADKDDSAEVMAERTTADLAFVFSDEVGHGVSAPIIAPVLSSAAHPAGPQ